MSRHLEQFFKNNPNREKTMILNRAICQHEAVLATDIDTCAENIATSIRWLPANIEQASILIHGLEEEYFLTYARDIMLPDDEGMVLSAAEVEAVVQPIKKALLDKLLVLLPHQNYEYYFNEKALQKPAEELDTNTLKYVIQDYAGQRYVWRGKPVSFPPSFSLATQKLASLPPHPNIVRIHRVGFKPLPSRLHWSSFAVPMIVEEVDFYTMKEDENFYSAQELLKATLDCMKAALHLLNNGLVIQDICPKNLGVKKSDKSGIMFDLDGLRLNTSKNIAIHPIPAHDGYRPIWQNAEEYIQQDRFFEKLMVYQFGLSLDSVLSNFLEYLSNAEYLCYEKEINPIITKMRSKRFDEVLLLPQAITELEQVAQEFYLFTQAPSNK